MGEKNDKEPRFTRLRDGRLVRYTTHEEFEAALRRLGIPVRNTTPKRPENRKQEIHLFQGPSRSFRAPDEGEEEDSGGQDYPLERE